MRKLAAVLLLLGATSAWGYRARPVSDLRFEGRADGGRLFVAGDGRESLVLSEPSIYTARRRVLTQKIVDGRPVGTIWEIASGRPAGLVWTGSEYLAAWTSDDVLWVGRVSRDGSLVSPPVQLPAPSPPSPLAQSALLASGRSVLALVRGQNGITAYPLDLAGRSAGAPVTHAWPEWVSAAGAAAGKFAVIFSNGMLMLLRGQALPRAPSIVCATRNDDDTVTVRWQPAQNALGIAIELELGDGMFRQIGVAAGGATTARIPLSGLEGDAVRVRAWNAGGLSAPSSIAPSLPPPFATLRSSMRACAGAPSTIAVTLSGTPPFTIEWSDGHVQTNVRSNTATRTVTVARDTTFTIVSVADASCEAGQVAESIRVSVDPQTRIHDQTQDVRVRPGDTATLSVVASDATSYAWFEGAPGDTSRPAGSNAATFTTPPLTRSTQYWARVSNRCGSVDSQAMSVLVNAKRRAARR
jgi:uncharacterized cupredoxin-like copper-binding protein